MLDNKLIEASLALTGKTMGNMKTLDTAKAIMTGKFHNTELSIEKFCYYLLSKPFLSEYEPYYGIRFKDSMRYRVGHAFQEAITAYQDGNETPLIKLLKLCPTDQTM